MGTHPIFESDFDCLTACREEKMAAIRHALQRDVFTARDERLLGVVHVTKNKSKSKKNNFLCLAVTSEQPVQVSVSVVKKGARNDELYKRHIQWLLTDLK